MPKKTELPATAEEPEILPEPVADEVIDQVVAEINSLYHNQTLTFHLGVGRVIVERLYGGDREAWRSRGTKDTSFRKLAEREDFIDGVSAAVLRRATAIYDMCAQLELLDPETGESTWIHLGTSHLRAVLGLPDSEQKRLLTRAEDKKWTVEKLESEVRKARPSDNRGRKPLPIFQKGFNKLLKAIEEAVSEPVPEDVFSSYGNYSPEDARKTLHRVETELGKLNALRDQIEARIAEAEAEKVAKEG